MKTRQGFVSNSSSSSFLVGFRKDAFPKTPEDVKKVIFGDCISGVANPFYDEKYDTPDRKVISADRAAAILLKRISAGTKYDLSKPRHRKKFKERLAASLCTEEGYTYRCKIEKTSKYNYYNKGYWEAYYAGKPVNEELFSEQQEELEEAVAAYIRPRVDRLYEEFVTRSKTSAGVYGYAGEPANNRVDRVTFVELSLSDRGGRGDAEEGEDILEHGKTFINIPHVHINEH